ncbi:MAG: aspartate aminotransferase family protein [Haloferacaceae archaeon]
MADGYDYLSWEQRTTESARLHEEALETFPGGVSHNLRYFQPHPLYLDRAEGARVWDVDGNEYVDFWMNHITSVLGHAHPDVVSAVQEQAARGLHYGAPNEKALRLGRKIQEHVPSAERVRYCASGTEATMYAVRLARAFTGRDDVLKARGGWHGGSTDLAAAVHAPFDEPTTAGLPSGAEEHVLDFGVNDREEVERLFDEHEGDVACVIVEPMLLAGGGVEVEPSFLEFLRAETERRGALLVFDEVVTGFRVSPGTYQERVGVTPDLTTLGKFLGGGLPVGALAGRADLFENARPDVDVPPGEQVLAGGGTFTANPMTATAGLESISVLENEPVHAETESAGERVRERLRELFADLGVEASVLGTSSLFLPHFEPETALDSVGAVETRTNRTALFEFHRRLVDRGYYFLPGHMGSVSYQTSTEDLDGMLAASRDVAEELVAEGVL